MHKTLSPLKNEDGSLIVFTLMVLTLLTIVGLASIRTADTEIEIAGTELLYQRNFYLAEGAAMEAVRWLDDPANSVNLSTNEPSWMEPIDGELSGSGLDAFWNSEKTSAVDTGGDATFIADYKGVAPGYSLGSGGTKMHEIIIYGRSEKRGVAVIRLGYRKIF